jgi:O-antigen/teichoic acid export membrane protein
MHKYSYWIRSGKYAAIQKLFVLGTGILSFVLLTRILEPEGFGTWGIFIMIASITETARAALIKNGFVRYTQQSLADETAVIQQSALFLNGILSIVISIIFFFTAPYIADALKASHLVTMLRWYSVAFIISIAFSHFEMILLSRMNFRGLCWIYCVRQGVLLLPILFCMFFQWVPTMTEMSLYYLSAMAAGSIVGYFFVKEFIRNKITASKQWTNKLWHFGKFVFGTNVSSLAFRGTDNFLTSSYFGPGLAAFYSSRLRIGNLVDIPSQVFGELLFPKVASQEKKDTQAIKNLYEKTVGASLVFSIPVLLIIIAFPELILRVLAGENYVQAAPILRITAFFGFILPFLKQFGTVMDGTGHPQINFRIMLMAFAINIVTNLVGIYYFGPIGCAIGTATTYTIIFIVSQYILSKKFQISLIRVFEVTVSLYNELFLHGVRYLKLHKG